MNSFNKIINLYEKELCLGTKDNKKCEECNAIYKKPLLPWQIGSKFSTEKGGILIAGKPHRNEIPKGATMRESKIIDARKRGKELFKSHWAYWSYTRELLKSIYGSDEESWEHIALANVVKCTSTSGKDKTSLRCAKQCIIENGVIFKEIELLKPRKILFYTWSMHKSMFSNITFAENGTVIEHTSNSHKRKCGKKQLGWWDRTLTANWGSKVDFLVLGHPERMKKDEYVSMVSDWLKNP